MSQTRFSALMGLIFYWSKMDHKLIPQIHMTNCEQKIQQGEGMGSGLLRVAISLGKGR